MGPRLRSVDASGPLSTSFWGSPSWQVDYNEGLMRTVEARGETGWVTVYFEESRLVLVQLIGLGGEYWSLDLGLLFRSVNPMAMLGSWR